MKRLVVFLMCLVGMLSLGCSSGYECDELGEAQDALACAYPIGSIGATSSPTGPKVTQFLVTGPKTVTAKYSAGPWVSTKTLEWDPASATTMSGGWTGAMITKVSIQSVPGELRLRLNGSLPDEAVIVFGNNGVGSPFGNGFEMNQGVTKIEMVNSVSGELRTMRFTGWHNGAQSVVDRQIPGTGGC
jgi:hypothetical protein